MPWNFPFIRSYGLLHNNGRKHHIIKHASMVPQCGIAMEELFKEAQAPEGLYTNLISGRRVQSEMKESKEFH
jgi:succinate-semialdehyde dehydrogenase/glutarate-semialdehyde dehydrogenase